MARITGQMFRDIIDYVNADFGYDRSYDSVERIEEDVFYIGDTLYDVGESGFMIYDKSEPGIEEYNRQFVSLQIPDVLNWVAAGRPILDYMIDAEDTPEMFKDLLAHADESLIPKNFTCVELSRSRFEPSNLNDAEIIIYTEKPETNYLESQILYHKDAEYSLWLRVLKPFILKMEKKNPLSNL